MTNFTDIYYKIDSRIVEQGFWQFDITKKKILIDKELKLYALEKLRQLNKEYYLQSSADTNLTIDSLVNMLASNINKEEHMNTLCHFIHYILQVAGSLQGHSIVWWVEESEELINEPFIEFNEKGFWGTLITHKETDYVQAFNFVYEVFNKYFMAEHIQKLIRIKNSDIK